ncbi:MAG: FHA domain-containing protein [Phycisphaerae bacterium]|jgi:pSer/pThr/pTyr-binding forkhead associated (FHA) protein|nr:FHA domain-containing protein [Phycisphaerae bacterium]HQL53127.1 FHA domain-containing protein [Phycisphaerae bacterium]
MNVVLVMFKDNERREFPLSGDKTVIGRRQDCQLRIPTKDVSRQHCVLIIDDASLVAKDLGSSNGTFVNGKRIAESELKPGDRLRLGPVTFVVQINGKPAEIKPEDVTLQSTAEPTAAADDEETFDLNEEDFDLDDPLSALEDDDDDDMP